MDRNLRERFCSSTNAVIDLTSRLWEPWLSMCRIGSLLLVEPWDNAMRAFAKGAEWTVRRSDAGHAHAPAIGNAPVCSKREETNALVMHNLAKLAPAEPQVHVFCPSCGELTTIRTMGPMMLEPSMEEITYRCVACGTETRVELSKHARFSINVNEARYFAT